MDEELRSLMGWTQEADTEREATLRVVDAAKGEVELERPDGAKRYTLKPLKDLYGPDKPNASINTTEDAHLPLLMAIEQPIVRLYRRNPRLTDGQVLLTMQALAMNPETQKGDDALAADIQTSLKLLLSLNEYSRQEVKLAVRKIAKSIERHTRESGTRGYLDFLLQYLPA